MVFLSGWTRWLLCPGGRQKPDIIFRPCAPRQLPRLWLYACPGLPRPARPTDDNPPTPPAVYSTHSGKVGVVCTTRGLPSALCPFQSPVLHHSRPLYHASSTYMAQSDSSEFARRRWCTVELVPTDLRIAPIQSPLHVLRLTQLYDAYGGELPMDPNSRFVMGNVGFSMVQEWSES